LDFATERVFIYALGEGNQYKPLAMAEYAEVISLQVGGRGSITTGGGWSGGGFGLSGIVTGALLAGALNQVTTRSTIETIIHFRTTAGELVVFNNQYTPQQLSVFLSPVFTRIEAANRITNAPQTSPIDQLRVLGDLLAKGTVTEDEFQSLKSALLKADESK
jgi:hypothetical protein